MSNIASCWALVAALIILQGVRALSAHPLDPLSGREIAAAVAVLRASGKIDAGTWFALIDLDEPPKADVLAWKPGQPFARHAFIVARRERTVYEALVDLGARKLMRWEAVPNVQTAILAEEWKEAQEITRADPGWQAAMRKRGYTDFDHFFCAPLSAGYFADPAEEGRRLLRVTCFETAGSRSNLWARPIEGLYAVVDLDEKRCSGSSTPEPFRSARTPTSLHQSLPPTVIRALGETELYSRRQSSALAQMVVPFSHGSARRADPVVGSV